MKLVPNVNNMTNSEKTAAWQSFKIAEEEITQILILCKAQQVNENLQPLRKDVVDYIHNCLDQILSIKNTVLDIQKLPSVIEPNVTKVSSSIS